MNEFQLEDSGYENGPNETIPFGLAKETILENLDLNEILQQIYNKAENEDVKKNNLDDAWYKNNQDKFEINEAKQGNAYQSRNDENEEFCGQEGKNEKEENLQGE